MPKTYTRLTEDERYQIYEGVTEKRPHRDIAILIKKHHSTVSNKVKRNTGLRGYRPKQAQEKDRERIQKKTRYRKLTMGVQRLIAENIQYELLWSTKLGHKLRGCFQTSPLPWWALAHH